MWLEACGDWLRAQRSLVLASPAFQRWAGAFPLTRPIARRRARALFDLCAGFVYSHVLAACAELGILEHLREGPASTDALAAHTGVPVSRLRILLAAAASLGLLSTRRGERYALGDLGAALLGNPGLLPMISHHTLLQADLLEPCTLWRTGPEGTRLARYWAYAGVERPAELSGDRVEDYSHLMASSQPLIAAEILKAWPVRGYRQVLDIGGGEGIFLSAAAATCPTLRLHLFDLPQVAARASARFERLGLGLRAEVTGGDFFSDPIPGGADLVTLVRILHDHDDEPALHLLRRIRSVLAPGATLLVAEPLSGAEAAGPMADAYLAIYLLAMGQGRPRRRDELEALLTRAGFSEVQCIKTDLPMLASILVARVPDKTVIFD